MLFSRKKSTLLFKAPDLQELALKLDELLEQEKDLLLSFGANAADPLNPKSKIFETLMQNIKDEIQKFNKEIPENPISKLEFVIQFTQNLLKMIMDCLDENLNLLNTHRNKNKETGSYIIDGTVIGGSLLVAFLSGSWTVCVGALIASRFIGGSIKQATSVDDPKSRTVRLLDDVIKLLVIVEQNKGFELKLEKQKIAPAFPPKYIEAEVPQYQPLQPR